MKKNGVFKKCEWCKKSFYVKKCLVNKKFYCSKKCHIQSQKGQHNSPLTEFKKGQKSWNRETKGIMKANKTSFKKGKEHLFFKGKIKHRGYIFIYSPNHPFKTNHNYVKRSRLVMEKKLDRFLLPEEIVHHINHIRDDDRIKNLMLFSNESKHQTLHEFLKKTN